MCAKTRQSNWRNRTDLGLNEIATLYNPVLRGWIEYYGCYVRSALNPVLRHFNKTLVKWAMHKYKRFRGKKTKAMLFIKEIFKRQPQLFEHWKRGMTAGFA